ncbi:hypothetical protein CEY09_03905 [Achromobacter marplatensis]|uniref:Type 1 fimbria pilin n=2 Tax=Achromobacter marplatensis TaxID=470868 RepID=A0ABX9GHI5_9BURK|nr:hypothetical protein CEY09_03905 [Achromobacter marplatensis]RBP22330.1 type 1 fimbria pilin [Achromobacter marplatensis]CAB3657389.1 hypothetical protein LMG26219_03105 [Achromobacter marplatensis]
MTTMSTALLRLRFPNLLCAVLGVAGLAGPSLTHAQLVHARYAICDNVSASITQTLQLPATISVPRDSQPGQVIALTNWVVVDAPTRGVCRFSTVVRFEDLEFAAAAGYGGRVMLPAPIRTYVEDGLTYSVYALDKAPGVGVIFSFRPRVRVTAGPGCNDIHAQQTQQSQFDRLNSLGLCGGNVPSIFAVGATVRAKLIRYAPIAEGTRVNPVLAFEGYPIARDASNTRLPGNPLATNLRVMLGATVINVLTCSTSDVWVDMKRVGRSDFKGVNGPLKSFGINLNCPANMNRITVRLDPNTAEIGNQSIVALDSRSSAKGVGVQFLTASDAAFPLRTAQTVTQYRSDRGGSFDIPLKARYVQTGGPISPGTANTTMTFTLTYE